MAVSVHEAKTNLSKYLAGVENGLEIVIARGKKLVAMTISKVAGRGSRVAGVLGSISQKRLVRLREKLADFLKLP